MFNDEFFPTPHRVALSMLSAVSKEARYFLEPSAGKGDLAEIIKGNRYDYSRRKVDCIEAEPELVSILTGKEFPVVGFDWLTYDGVCYYDAIIMNPPFSNGDAHLLKAWDFLHSGEIVCLLNSETLANPYSASRQRLAQIVAQHGRVEHLGACFSDAQRRTDINVDMVYLKKAAIDDSPELWAKSEPEKETDITDHSPANMPAVIDTLGNMEHYYNKGNEHMLEAFKHIRLAARFMEGNGIASYGYDEIVKLALKDFNEARAEFVKKHRRDAWLKVFDKMQFRKWLDKMQTSEFIRDIERNGNIPFKAENIRGTLENVFSQRRKLFEKSCANVFDELRKYDPENSYHSEGWKSNSGHRINKKIVFPYGCTFEKLFGTFNMCYGSSKIDIYNDLDRIMCVLDGQDFAKCHSIAQALESKFRILRDNKGADMTTESRYFEIKFFKKGTVHLRFKEMKLLEDFNITAAAGRAWLGDDTRAA